MEKPAAASTGKTVARPSPKSTSHTWCAVCGYQLTGLPDRGTCPECGALYNPDLVVGQNFPSTFSLIVRFGWPLGLDVICTLGLGLAPVFANGLEMALIWTWVIAVAACFVNVPLQVWLLRRSGVTRAGSPGQAISQLMIILSIISIIGPFIVFGGCLCVVAYQ